MMRRALLVALLLAGAGLTACAPTSRFDWGAYDMALYAYAKNPGARDAYRAALVTAIERGRLSNRVAPGLLAELGYLHLEDGQQAAAIQCFEEEMARFPEAAPFMSGVIARLTGADAVAQTQAGDVA
jgi:hypothetical protein